MKRSFVLFGFALSALVGLTAAEERQRRDPQDVPEMGARTVTARPVPVPTAPVVGKDSPIRGNQTDASNVGGGLLAPAVPVQTYWGNNAGYDYGNWIRCSEYMDALFRDFAFLPIYDYYWRYAQGDSPLTLDSLAVALRKSRVASAELVATSSELESLIQDHRAGRLSVPEMKRALQEQSKRIRSSLKTIRKDAYIDFLDLNRDARIPEYGMPGTVAELARLSDELQGTAKAIDFGIRGFVDKDMTRVVAARDLQQPSLESLAKRADRLAKAIQKFGDSM